MERQEKLKAEYEAKQLEDTPVEDFEKCGNYDLSKDDEEEEKGIEEKQELAPENSIAAAFADKTKQFLITLLNPDTPLSKKKELLMA